MLLSIPLSTVRGWLLSAYLVFVEVFVVNNHNDHEQAGTIAQSVHQAMSFLSPCKKGAEMVFEEASPVQKTRKTSLR